MKTLILIAVAMVAAFQPVHAQIAIDSVAGIDFTFEGLVQADANWYDSDLTDLDGDPGDSDDADYDLRTAQIYLKGKGPCQIDWVLGYDGKADKWLDANRTLPKRACSSIGDIVSGLTGAPA